MSVLISSLSSYVEAFITQFAYVGTNLESYPLLLFLLVFMIVCSAVGILSRLAKEI